MYQTLGMLQAHAHIHICQSHSNAKETLWNKLMQQQNPFSYSKKPNLKYPLVKWTTKTPHQSEHPIKANTPK